MSNLNRIGAICTIMAVVCLGYMIAASVLAAHYDMPVLAYSKYVGFAGFACFVVALGIMSRLEDVEGE